MNARRKALNSPLGLAVTVPQVMLLLACSGILEPQVITSTDGVSQIEMPFGWDDSLDLHDEADLSIGQPLAENYVIVLSEPKAVFDGIDHHQHSAITRESMDAQPISDGRDLVIGQLAATQFTLTSTTDGNDVTYLHTTVDGQHHFHQILSWTLTSRFERNEPILQSVIGSFRETGVSLTQDVAKSMPDWRGSQRLTAAGTDLVMHLPATWVADADLHDEATLGARREGDESYIVVLTDIKSDLDGMTLQRHSDFTRGLMRNNLGDSYAESGPKNLVIDGMPALQYQLDATMNAVRLTYLHTTIEGTDEMHQVLAWGPTYGFERRKPHLESIVSKLEDPTN